MWQSTDESVRAEIERGHVAKGVGTDPVPTCEGRAAEPSSGIRPSGTARGLEQRLQRDPVGLVTERPPVPVMPFEPSRELDCARGAETIVGVEREVR